MPLSLDECMLRGFGWFRSELLPIARKLSQSSTRGGNVAWILELTADVYFVVDCVDEAIRWYRRAAQKTRRNHDILRQLAEAQDVLKYQFAPGYPLSSLSDDQQIKLDEADRKAYLGLCKAIALGKPVTPTMVGDPRPWMQLIHSRWLAATSKYTEAFQKSYARVAGRQELNLTAADWFYFPPVCWDCVPFWKTLYQRRQTIQSLALTNFDRSAERVGPPEVSHLVETAPKKWNRTVHEVLLRFHVYRSSGNYSGLQRLASMYPQWGDVASSLKHCDQYGRPPLKDELLPHRGSRDSESSRGVVQP